MKFNQMYTNFEVEEIKNAVEKLVEITNFICDDDPDANEARAEMLEVFRKYNVLKPIYVQFEMSIVNDWFRRDWASAIVYPNGIVKNIYTALGHFAKEMICFDSEYVVTREAINIVNDVVRNIVSESRTRRAKELFEKHSVDTAIEVVYAPIDRTDINEENPIDVYNAVVYPDATVEIISKTIVNR